MTTLSPDAACTAKLQCFQGITRMDLPSGQVLVYRGHRPRGLFVVLSGHILLGRARRGAPLLFPNPAALEQASAATVATEGEVTLLYVPRSVALSRPEIVRLLQGAHRGQESMK